MNRGDLALAGVNVLRAPGVQKFFLPLEPPHFVGIRLRTYDGEAITDANSLRRAPVNVTVVAGGKNNLVGGFLARIQPHFGRDLFFGNETRTIRLRVVW